MNPFKRQPAKGIYEDTQRIFRTGVIFGSFIFMIGIVMTFFYYTALVGVVVLFVGLTTIWVMMLSSMWLERINKKHATIFVKANISKNEKFLPETSPSENIQKD